jgi:hypothetical protein
VLPVVPSPKFQLQEVGVPADVSVNWTDCPTSGEAGLNVNDAVSATATVTVRVAVLDPVPFVAVKVTVFDPAVAKAWLGFCAVEVVPSPKSQLQEVGVPADVSVNWMTCSAIGEVGLQVNDAARAGATTIVLVELFEPLLLVTVKETVLVPGTVKA